jgi:hypothetical protein
MVFFPWKRRDGIPLADIDGGEGIRIWKLPRNGRCGQVKKKIGRKEVKG